MIKSPFNYILSRQVVILYQSAILMIAFIVMWFVALYFNGYFKIAFNLFIGFIIFIFLFYPNFFFKLIINPFLFFLHKTKDINFLNKITLKIEDFQINIFKLQDSYLKIKVILLNFSHLIFGALAVFFIMKAFAIDGNILLAFAIIASISWIKILMGFTLGGLGTSEFGIALLFVLLGVPLEAAVQDAIIIRVSLLITTVVLGLISLLFSWYFLE